jgi:hypothetical protein
LAGCGSNNPAAPVQDTTDRGQVNSLITQGYGLVDDGSSLTSESEGVSSLRVGTDGTLAAIRPFYFWRTLTSETISWDVAFSDTDDTGHPATAVVTVHRHLIGNLNIIPASAGDSTHADSTSVIHKPHDDLWTRHVLLKRVPFGSAGATHWRFAGTSLVDIVSSTNTTQIQSVRVQSTGLDTTLTDPAAFFLLRGVMRVNPSDSVRVTVTTNHANDVVLLHHAGFRRRFRNNGDGTYTIKWLTGPLGGWRHFGVDAIAHTTLFDDTAVYDSNRWFIPFAVVSEPVVDYFP